MGKKIVSATKPDRAADAVAKLTSDFALMIREGIADPNAWRKTWKAIASSQPWNVVTKHRYAGGNSLILAITSMVNGWSNNWSTFAGWETLGAKVNKGEKATWILAPSTFVGKTEAAAALAEGRDPRRMTTFRGLPVFNAAQVDGWDPVSDAVVLHTGLEEIQAFLASTGADIEHAAHHDPHYRPSADKIGLPAPGQFVSAAAYAATALHEVGHWTGHTTRLDRKNSNGFGTPGYAKEELIAELASATLSNLLGYEVEPSLNHGHYLSHWLTAIQDDPRALWTAATAATKAVEFLAKLTTKEIDKFGPVTKVLRLTTKGKEMIRLAIILICACWIAGF